MRKKNDKNVPLTSKKQQLPREAPLELVPELLKGYQLGVQSFKYSNYKGITRESDPDGTRTRDLLRDRQAF
jgi:hypothetical protein